MYASHINLTMHKLSHISSHINLPHISMLLNNGGRDTCINVYVQKDHHASMLVMHQFAHASVHTSICSTHHFYLIMVVGPHKSMFKCKKVTMHDCWRCDNSHINFAPSRLIIEWPNSNSCIVTFLYLNIDAWIPTITIKYNSCMA